MMKALVVYKATHETKVIEIPKLKATPYHVIITVMACPLHPADPLMMAGIVPMLYKSFPDFDCLGFEGSGIVEEIGEGVPENLKGKKVAFTRMISDKDFFGCITEYARVCYRHLLILEDEMTFEECSGLFIAPLTTLGLLDVCNEVGAKGILATAGSSSVAKIIAKVGLQRGLQVISTVRKKEQIAPLQKQGIRNVLDTSDPNFVSQLSKLAAELNVTAALDCISGDMVGKLVDALPFGSTIILYGALGGPVQKMNTGNVIFKNISLRGSDLFSKPFCHDEKIFIEYLKVILDDMKSTKNFKTEVAARFMMDKFTIAIESFPLLASSGKVIITPNFKLE